MKQRKYARQRTHPLSMRRRRWRGETCRRVASARAIAGAIGIMSIARTAGAIDTFMRGRVASVLTFGAVAAACPLLALALTRADEDTGPQPAPRTTVNRRGPAGTDGAAKPDARGDRVTTLLLAMLVVPTTVAAVWQLATGYVWEGCVVGGVTLACVAVVGVSLLQRRPSERSAR